MGLKIGDAIPLFTLPDAQGNQFSIKQLIGEKPFVLYFYPKNNTPGCTKEACDFRDRYEDFKNCGAEVVGISAETPKSHANFQNKHQLPFILLSDKNNEVRRKFKIRNNFLLVPGRETYVIDEKGKVVMVFNSLNASEHMKRALLALSKK
ncbi:peroxiredoxin [Maribacter sp. 4U21]|uniref:peroxiredoxin n=1 Tax=Maribacter sp. 4U21 TaxID=1889779 RepID=UPI000C15BB88|nr:peroxiredoxin [Maribacter sp. 4U21]PIB27005.1 peroxiredoxin [Maribacter sp. 4U21]